jgi:hypothetical protein
VNCVTAACYTGNILHIFCVCVCSDICVLLLLFTLRICQYEIYFKMKVTVQFYLLETIYSENKLMAATFF